MKKSEEIALHKEIRNGFKFDPNKMYFCQDYEAQNGIVVREPRIGEIIETGEEVFYKNLNIWVTNTTSYRVALWHMDIDWCKFTDYELFCFLYKAADPDVMSLILPNMNIASYEQMGRVIGEDQYELVLYSKDED